HVAPRRGWMPLVEENRLPRRPPPVAIGERVRRQALAETEVHVVRCHTAAKSIVLAACRQLNLCEYRVRVDVRERPYVAVLIWTLQRARDIQQEVGGAHDLGVLLIPQAVPATVERTS